MKQDAVEWLKQALKLPPEARAALAGSLLDSLDEVLATEQLAAETYRGILDLVIDNDELHDMIEQIYFAELRSVEELTQLMQS